MKKTEKWQRLLTDYEAVLAAEVNLYLENLSETGDERERVAEKGVWLAYIAQYSAETQKKLESYNTAGNKEPFFQAALERSIRDALQRSVQDDNRVVREEEVVETVSALNGIFAIKSMSKVVLSMEQLARLID